jgi:sigma-B regulation protein RsbU (phosphoserine phosphatase)
VLDPEDRLFVFKDGITEALSVEFGEERLEASVRALRDLPALELVLGIISALDEFTRGAEQSDDITCLAIKRDLKGSWVEIVSGSIQSSPQRIRKWAH